MTSKSHNNIIFILKDFRNISDLYWQVFLFHLIGSLINAIIWNSFLLLKAAVNISKCFFGANSMAKGSEQQHCRQKRKRNSCGYYYCELSKYNGLSTEESTAAAQRCNSTTENTNTHLRKSLLNLLIPCIKNRVLVCSSKVHHIVH